MKNVTQEKGFLYSSLLGHCLVGPHLTKGTDTVLRELSIFTVGEGVDAYLEITGNQNISPSESFFKQIETKN